LFRPALGPAQASVKCVPTGRDVDQPFLPSAEMKENNGAIPPLPIRAFMVCIFSSFIIIIIIIIIK
jgi:hypothetical protein